MEEDNSDARVIGSDFLINIKSIRRAVEHRKKVITVEFWTMFGELNIDFPFGFAFLIVKLYGSKDSASNVLLRVEVPAEMSVGGTIYKSKKFVGKHVFYEMNGDEKISDPFFPEWVFNTVFDVKISKGGKDSTNLKNQTVTVPIKLKYILGLMGCLEADWDEPKPA